MKKLKTPRDSKRYQDVKTRPTTVGDVFTQLLPVRTVGNIRRGHYARGMRDIGRFGWEPWERDVSRSLNLAEMQRLNDANRLYRAMERIQGLMATVKRHSEQLERTLAYRQTLMDAMQDILMTTDSSGIITEINRATERISGYGQEELLGQPLDRFFTDPERVRAGVEKVMLEGKVKNYDLTLVGKDGQKVPVSYNATVLFDHKGRPSGVLSSARDMTEISELINKLQAATEEMEAANEELQATNEELQATTDELARTSAYRQTLMDTMRGILLTTDSSGIITEINRATERVSGYNRKELLGQPLDRFFTDPERARAGRERAIQEGEYADEKLIVAAKDGQKVPVSWHATALRGLDGRVSGVLSSALDIGELKRAEEELRQASAYTRSLIEANLDSLVTISPEGKITDVNESTVQMTGVPREKLIGTDFSDYFTDPEKARAGYHLALAKGSVSDYPLTVRHKGGKLSPVLYNANLYRDHTGKVQGVFAAARDITALKLVESELHRSHDELEKRVAERTADLAQVTAKMEASNKELEQFAYVASHDLQEPLRMVTSYLQLISKRYKGKIDAEADTFIEYAVDGASRMQQMIQALLTFSRVGSRGKPLEPVECEAVLEQALANLEMAIEESGAAITHDPLPTMKADGDQLAQLFQNLLSNSIKFHGEEPPRIHISAERREKDWLFSVRDNGLGFDPQYKDRIFMVFQRLQPKEKVAGSGIGLAICKKIVERHGGTIWADSEPGKGSTFYFTIPAAGVEGKG